MRGDETSSELSATATHFVRLAREELGHMSVRLRAEGFLRLVARRSVHHPRKRLLFGLGAVLMALCLALLAGPWIDGHHLVALSYAVESGQIGRGGVIEGDGTTEPKLRFSDGTEIVLLAGSRGQVRSVDEHGARIAVAGKAKVAIVPWHGSHWLFDVGPFLMTVKGTAFTAEWKDAEERLEVVLKTGTVAVSGPLSDEAIMLRAGQRLLISLRDKEVVIRDIDATGEMGDASHARSIAEPYLRHFENGTYAAAARAPTQVP
jgi:ferric-dicitrate binding protein FerR (iron transport regulator)